MKEAVQLDNAAHTLTPPSTSELRQLVEKWRSRLAPEWRLTEIEVGFPDDCDDDGQRASVWRSDDYHNARIYFSEKWVNQASPRELEQTVIHEIVHLVTHELAEAASRPTFSLGSEAGSLARRAITHHEEQLVERLAWAFVDLDRRCA